MNPIFPSTSILRITDDHGLIREPGWLALAETVHRQLRPQLPADYVERMAQIFGGGGRMLLALRQAQVCGLAVYRCIENTSHGRELYVDDLVTDQSHRSAGVGRAMLQALEAQARDAGCGWLTLDSGTQRSQAHRFYFRERMTLTSFHFAKPLA